VHARRIQPSLREPRAGTVTRIRWSVPRGPAGGGGMFTSPSDTSTWAIAPGHVLRGHVHVPVTARSGGGHSTSPVTRERRQMPDSPSADPSAGPAARSCDHARKECWTN